MGGDNEDGSVKRSAIPLIAGAIVLAQFTMSGATYAGDIMTKRGCGRKPLFLAGLLTLPVRCALIIFWKDAGEAWLLSTQILDGLGGGFFGLLHPYLVNDIAFGSGRFNVLSKYAELVSIFPVWYPKNFCNIYIDFPSIECESLSTHPVIPFLYAVGLTASCFGLGATLSNLLGQLVVEKMGHVASLTGSLLLSVIPVLLFSWCMPETYGQRGTFQGKDVYRVEAVRCSGQIV